MATAEPPFSKCHARFDSTVSDNRGVTKDSEGSALLQARCRLRLHLEQQEGLNEEWRILRNPLTSPHVVQMRKPAGSELCGSFLLQELVRGPLVESCAKSLCRTGF